MLQRQLVAVAALILIVPLMPEVAYGSESYRCGRYIIDSDQRNGTTQYEVLKKCGEPSARNGYTWIYENPGAAPRAITFDFNGRVSRIERLSK